MDPLASLLLALIGFTLISLSSKNVGNLFRLARLPLISGFLFTGILAGPFVLQLLTPETLGRLEFIDKLSLAFIAFAAGSELYLPELRGRLRSISSQVAAQLVFTWGLGALGVYLLAGFLPFLDDAPQSLRVAASLMAGAILVARSPASAIAIMNELRARGPFTYTMLGVTVLKDFAVIVLFAVNSSLADALLAADGIDWGIILVLPLDLGLSFGLGLALYRLLRFLLGIRAGRAFKTALVLLAGYGVFVISASIRDLTHEHWPFEILLEPLLICMIGGFLITNRSPHRGEFSGILFDIGPAVYIAFFTLTGASLEIGVLPRILPIVLAIVSIRLIAIFLSTWIAGSLSGDPPLHNRIGWMAYVTQAGVSLGLAKEAAGEFPEMGAPFATLMIAVIVVNQLVGPPFCKWAIRLAGESRTRGETAGFDGIRDAIIFGLEGHSLTLARQLEAHDWDVKIASRRAEEIEEEVEASDLEIHHVTDHSLKSLDALDARNASCIVTLLSDDENYQICELAYQNYGTTNLVVRLNDHEDAARFQELGCLIVDPSTAIVNLLDHSVRSPRAASLMLGLDTGQDVIDVKVRNQDMDGRALRDLRLPLDCLILSVRRDGTDLISHGYTELELGDLVTIVGSSESLREVMMQFEGQRWSGVIMPEGGPF